METRARSIAKALTWQLIGFVAMAFIGYLFTGSPQLGGKIAAVSVACGLVAYVLHERAWAGIRWGRD